MRKKVGSKEVVCLNNSVSGLKNVPMKKKKLLIEGQWDQCVVIESCKRKYRWWI